MLLSILYSALNTGAKTMAVATGVPRPVLVAIIAFALMFVAAPGLVRSIWRIGPPPESMTPSRNDVRGRAENPL